MKLTKRTNKRLGWRRDLPDVRDFTLDLPSKKLAPKVNLESGFGNFGVYDQGNLGSCTANAIAGAVVFAELKEGPSDTTLTYPSRLFIYYGEREIEGSVNSDAGAEIRDGMKVVAKAGYPQEMSWPYKVGKFAVKPPAAVYTEAKKDHVTGYYRVTQTLYSMRLCLAHGFPFVFGISVYDSFWNNSNGDIPMPSGSLAGGHAILCTGYDDTTKMFDFRNSWGSGWGQNGSGRIPYAYLTDLNLAGDFWVVKKETL